METTLAPQHTRVAAGLLGVSLIVLILAGTALLFRATGGGKATDGRVLIVEPQNGAAVSSPVLVKMAAEKFKVEPAGMVANGRGHLHILVDTPCMAAGQVIPKDDRHLHYGKGQLEAELALAPGTHTLCLQAANGAHVALDGEGMRQTISVLVK
jgi:hypothetical protein